MKVFLSQKIILPFLAFIARKIISKNRPLIIGVTGSTGKSSTKEAIYTVLKTKFKVRRSLGNLNNEIGLPVSVISDIDPKKSPLKWLKLICRGLFLCVFKSTRYPEILVLEMAVDRPKDMDYLIKIAPPKIGVITGIGISHLEFFKTQKGILKEKIKIGKTLGSEGTLIVNHDDPLLRSLKKNFKGSVFTFGFRNGADVLGSELKIGYSSELGEGISLAKGTSLRVIYKTIFLPLRLPHIISKAQVYAALAGVAVGLRLDMNLVEISEALKSFHSLPGRMRLIRGLNGNLIIDDTYNAAPHSVKSALEVLALIKSKKKVVIFGDMLELGEASKKAHEDLAGLFMPIADRVALVGKRTLETHRNLVKLGYPRDRIFHFRTVNDALPKLPEIAGKGSMILVKGSQGLRMEKATERLVSEKEWDKLPRQNKAWKRKPVIKV